MKKQSEINQLKKRIEELEKEIFELRVKIEALQSQSNPVYIYPHPYSPKPEDYITWITTSPSVKFYDD